MFRRGRAAEITGWARRIDDGAVNFRLRRGEKRRQFRRIANDAE